MQHVEMISRQERVTFVDIQEMTLPKSQNQILEANLHEASFLACGLLSMDFESMLCIWKMLLRLQGVFWYNL